mgnify:CR=1 FL=1
MGKGICADSYVGDRAAQELFRLNMGGSPELPCDMQKRLERQERWLKAKRRQKNNARSTGQNVYK